MKFLFVFHDPPYGTERTFNGLRWARELLRADDGQVRIFLFGDAVVSVNTGQQVPQGYYNIEKMIESLARHGADIGSCGSCLDARGILDEHLAKGAHRSSMAELSEWTNWADQVINV